MPLHIRTGVAYVIAYFFKVRSDTVGMLLFSHSSRPIFRYFLRATVIRRLNDISKEMDIVVHTLSTYPELNSSIKMEVGIEDCLHIEFEYNKSK